MVVRGELMYVKRGLWRNGFGAELRVIGRASRRTGIDIGFDTLGGIYVAESYDEIFKTKDYYLVCAASLADCGYELVEEEAPDD